MGKKMGPGDPTKRIEAEVEFLASVGGVADFTLDDMVQAMRDDRPERSDPLKTGVFKLIWHGDDAPPIEVWDSPEGTPYVASRDLPFYKNGTEISAEDGFEKLVTRVNELGEPARPPKDATPKLSPDRRTTE